ncbi:MAG: 3-dehydroquinate synthase [Candidatus Cloacimonetes bacterium]|nr:3-dehydroquinate synthase [Candidatus Cloacimonadota bacterium]MCF7867524.1 3-dehydroquinate synthase [Candidatus Cloacimonadota bacterium]MCF7882974.1 3-dehydroquinate synthase [Candidatus Cloacimonadota bacterium]
MKYKINNKSCEIIFDELRNIYFEDDKFVIIDRKLFELFPEKFNIFKERSHIFKANEENKNLENVKQILQNMHAKNVNRKTLIIGIGGGVTTDITGLAASLYKRGCNLMLIPTTLLSMVDAAIGGKTGINFEGIKNGIGNFYPAKKILIDTDFLKTLPQSEILAGMVEIIKMSFLPTSKLDSLLKENYTFQGLIEAAVRTKMGICIKDMEDKGLRRLLNLGHTFGHVLESASNYQINHGKAVAIGMRAAAKFSKRMKLIDQSEYNEINSKFILHDLPDKFSAKYSEKIKEKGLDILKQDKKADTKINLVLFKGRNDLQVFQIDNPKEIIETLLGFAND